MARCLQGLCTYEAKFDSAQLLPTLVKVMKQGTLLKDLVTQDERCPIVLVVTMMFTLYEVQQDIFWPFDIGLKDYYLIDDPGQNSYQNPFLFESFMNCSKNFRIDITNLISYTFFIIIIKIRHFNGGKESMVKYVRARVCSILEHVRVRLIIYSAAYFILVPHHIQPT